MLLNKASLASASQNSLKMTKQRLNGRLRGEKTPEGIREGEWTLQGFRDPTQEVSPNPGLRWEPDRGQLLLHSYWPASAVCLSLSRLLDELMMAIMAA